MATEMDAAAATCPVFVQGADNIRVVFRLRPVTEDEKKEERPTKSIVGAKALTDGKSIVVYSPKEESYKEYHFDHVFDAVTSQRTVYECAASHLVHGLISGKNACFIAYGQTGTGKTFTMFGNRRRENLQHESHEGTEGVVHHLIKDLFDITPTQEIKDGEEIGPSPSRASSSLNSRGIMCSFVEIYQDQIRDLLIAADESNSPLPKPKSKSTLTLRESFGKGAGGVFVAGAHWQSCHTKEDVMNLLERGNKSRTTSDTGMNADSSRSHGIFTIKYQGPRAKEGNARFLHVVDLAGSELAKKTNAVGQTMEESKKINKSLSALGNVVKAVTERRSHVPYRDSKLTRLLQDAIGGSALTAIILTASPSVRDTSETTSTIRFGMRAKNIKKPQARWNPTDNEEITDEIIAEENNWHGIRNDLFSSPGKYSEIYWEDDRDVSMIALDSSSLEEDEIVGATIIVPSAPTPPAESHRESSSLAGSSSRSSELSLKPSMLDSSILMTDLNVGEARATSPVASDMVLASREENEGMCVGVDMKDSGRCQLQGTEEHVSGSCVRSLTVATSDKQTPKEDSTVASHCGDGSELDIDAQVTDSGLSSDNFLNVGRRLFMSSKSDEVEREEEEKRLGSPDRKQQREKESPRSPSSCMDVQSETEASKKTGIFFMPPLTCFAILGILVIMPFFVHLTGYSKLASNNLHSSVNLKQSSVQILAFGNEHEAPSSEKGKPVEIYDDDMDKISVESESGDEREQLLVTTTNQSLSAPDYKKIRVLGEELSHHKTISSETIKERTASNSRRFSVSKDEDSELHGSTADPLQYSLKSPFCKEMQATSGLPEVTEKFLGEGCDVTTFSQTTHNLIGPSSDEMIRKCSSCFSRERSDDDYLIPEPLQVGKWDDVEDAGATTDKTAGNGDQSKLADFLHLLRFWELAVVWFVVRFTGSILRNRRRKMNALPERIPQTPVVLCCCTERLSSLKKQTLTNMCRDRSLKVSGTKSSLVERLLEAEGEYHNNLSYQTPKQRLYHESPKLSRGVSAKRSDHQQIDDLQKLTRSELRGRLRSMGLQISGNKPDLIHRLQTGERLRNLKVSALKELLREKGLKTSGKKSELFDRLMKTV